MLEVENNTSRINVLFILDVLKTKNIFYILFVHSFMSKNKAKFSMPSSHSLCEYI